MAAITREAIEAAAAEQNQALSEWVLSACLEKMARQ